MLILSLLLLQAAPETRIGVFDIDTKALDPALARTATDALATAIAAVPGYKVISKTELEAMIGAEKLKDSVGCNDVSCLAEIGMAAGVDRLVAGSVARADKAIVVSLQLINSKYVNVENRVTLTWEGDATRLTDLLGAAAELLVIDGARRKPGSLRVGGISAGAAVSVDGETRGIGPLTIDKLQPGVHRLRVEAPDFQSYQASFVVRSGQQAALDILMSEKTVGPVYTRWWFWTLAGVLVAGGVATGLGFGLTAKSTLQISVPVDPTGGARR